MLNACTKENNTLQTTTPKSTEIDKALEIKTYYPPEEVDAREKVLNFLNHTKTRNYESSFKTKFKDIEANEAMWTLEAASNLLVNENFKYEADLDGEALNYILEFELIKKDNELFIKGNELTSSFENLHKTIKNEVKSINKLPVLIDFVAVKSKSSKAVFEVNVILTTTKLNNFELERKASISQPNDDNNPCDPCLTANRCTGTNNFERLACDCASDYLNESPSDDNVETLRDIMAHYAHCVDPRNTNPEIIFCNIELLRNGGWQTAYEGYHGMNQEAEACARHTATNLLNEDICFAVYHGNVTPDHFFAMVQQRRVDGNGADDTWEVLGAFMSQMF